MRRQKALWRQRRTCAVLWVQCRACAASRRRHRACAVMRGALRAVPLMAAAVTGSGAGSKRARTEPVPRIGTHDGTFHCDEALACFLLRLLPRYRVRPRPPQALLHSDPVLPSESCPSSGSPVGPPALLEPSVPLKNLPGVPKPTFSSPPSFYGAAVGSSASFWGPQSPLGAAPALISLITSPVSPTDHSGIPSPLLESPVSLRAHLAIPRPLSESMAPPGGRFQVPSPSLGPH